MDLGGKFVSSDVLTRMFPNFADHFFHYDQAG